MAKKEKNPPAEKVNPGSEATGAEAPKKSGKLKLIIIFVVALLLGVGLAVGAMKFIGGGSATLEHAAEADAEEEQIPESSPANNTDAPIQAPTNKAGNDGHGGQEGASAVEQQGPHNIEFKSFVVNLSGPGKRFLKLSMSVEADTQELADEINSKMHQFQDIILLLLSSLSYDDIATLDGKMRLRNQMLNRINTQLSGGKVRNIYFSEFVVQ